MVSKNFDYKKAKEELDEILAWYEAGEVDVEQAITKYHRAELLLNQLNAYLSDASIKIDKLVKKQSSKSSK